MSVTVVGIVFRIVGGVALGWIFFGGLRLTVDRIPNSPRPGLFLATSFVLRTAVVILGMIALGGDRWQYYLAAVAGFMLAKLPLVGSAIGRTGPGDRKPVSRWAACQDEEDDTSTAPAVPRPEAH